MVAWVLVSGCGMYGDLYLKERETPPEAQVEELPPIAPEPPGPEPLGHGSVGVP